jgi:small multidrug resistance pump
MQQLYLALAIVSEVLATTGLKATNGFRRPVLTVVVLSLYALAFYLLSLTLRTVQVGVVYAIWSGVGLVLITLVNAKLYGQKPDWAAGIGMTLIIAGVLIINLYSKVRG